MTAMVTYTLKPAISVIIPSYNADRYLHKAIESILSQTFRDFELIIVDDGSTDRSAEVAERFKDSRIRRYRRQHSGLVSTLNFAVAQSHAEWIARMDADDISLPHRLECQLRYLQDHPKLHVLGGSARLIDNNGNEIGRPVKPPSGHMAIMRMLTGRSPGPGLIHPSVLIRKEAFLRAGGYREEFPVCEDLDLWLRLSQFGELGSLVEDVLLLRKHSDNVTLLKADTALKSRLAAQVCHELHSRTNIDIVKERPDAWARCSHDINAAVIAGRLGELALMRRYIVDKFRRNYLRGGLTVLGRALSHPRMFWQSFNHANERRITHRIVISLHREITKVT